MRAPDFWENRGLPAVLLLPLSWVWQALAKRRAIKEPDFRPPVLTICVGNLVAGGAGKTPVVLSLIGLLKEIGEQPHVIGHGYKAGNISLTQVDPAVHDARQVGDEALLQAAEAPTWIAPRRPEAARAAVAAGASCLILDDGFQDPSVAKDLSLLVIDSLYGLGNGWVMPAGPLREDPKGAAARATALILNGARGNDDAPPLPFKGLVLRGGLTPRDGGAALAGKRLIAFAAIARPQRFFQTLRDLGANIVATRQFGDHQRLTEDQCRQLERLARDQEAGLMTTEKDAVRLTPEFRQKCAVLKVDFRWADREAVLTFLKEKLALASPHGPG